MCSGAGLGLRLADMRSRQYSVEDLTSHHVKPQRGEEGSVTWETCDRGEPCCPPPGRSSEDVSSRPSPRSSGRHCGTCSVCGGGRSQPPGWCPSPPRRSSEAGWTGVCWWRGRAACSTRLSHHGFISFIISSNEPVILSLVSQTHDLNKITTAVSPILGLTDSHSADSWTNGSFLVLLHF